jgi:hypothetical protein
MMPVTQRISILAS